MQRDLGGSNRAREDTRVQDPKVEVGLFGEELSRDLRFGFARRGQVDVGPPSEEVEVVPGRLAVSQEDEVGHLASVLRSSATSN